MATCSSSGGSGGKSAAKGAGGGTVVARSTATTKKETSKIPTPAEAVNDRRLENNIADLIRDSDYNINLNRDKIINELNAAKPGTALVIDANNRWHPEIHHTIIKQNDGTWTHHYMKNKTEEFWSNNLNIGGAYSEIWNAIANARGWLD